MDVLTENKARNTVWNGDGVYWCVLVFKPFKV